MPTVTIQQAIAPEQAAEALQQQLGDRYTVDSHREGGGVLRVRQGGLAYANVHVASASGATTFRVHGGGLIIGRIANELGIARTVATAIKDAYPSRPASSG
jgi:hypothetical protein